MASTRGKAASEAATKRPPGRSAASPSTAKRRRTRAFVVRPDEKPWTAKEVTEVRSELEAEQSRLEGEVAVIEQDLQDRLRDGGDGAGNDQADVGSTTLERDAEMSLANNTRDMLFQVQRALERLDDGSYGVCESCGNAIGKLRLMAFPRATLCLPCKQREERR